MRLTFNTVVWLVLAVLLATVVSNRVWSAEQPSVPAYLFWQQGCPYCAQAKTELRMLSDRYASVQLKDIEIGSNAESDALFARTLSHFDYEQAAVPLVIIGDRSFLGFLANGRSREMYRQAIERCLRESCADTVAAFSGGAQSRIPASQPPKQQGSPTSSGILPETIQLPFFGELKTGDLSLPLLTVLLAAIDGFNPCAMWVLVFLIGLLLGLKNERRMWLLGAAFLGATAVMYFVVMAAWLNLILFLGIAVWVRLVVGTLAVGGGLFFLREFWTQPAGTCPVANPGRRQRIMDALQSVINNNQLVLSIVGIMALAVVVNLIELVCSAGIPAVYTQVLALSNLPGSSYYAYLCLYILVFMLDDVAIFATAMFALRVSGLTGTYARYSHLIGGVVLLAVGAILLLRPELLTFS